MALLPSSHFLALPRPDVLVGPPAGVVDTTTLAAHDFDVDTRTGFMPPDPPLTRLPSQWESWEQSLDDAQSHRLQLGCKIGITDEEKARSESWRARVAQVRRRLFPFAWHLRQHYDSIATDVTHSQLVPIRAAFEALASCPGMDHAFLYPLFAPGSRNTNPRVHHRAASAGLRTAATPPGDNLFGRRAL